MHMCHEDPRMQLFSKRYGGNKRDFVAHAAENKPFHIVTIATSFLVSLRFTNKSPRFKTVCDSKCGRNSADDRSTRAF